MQGILVVLTFLVSSLSFAQSTVAKKKDHHVVVKNSARFFLTRGDKTPHIHVKDAEGYSTMRLVRTRGSWVSVLHQGVTGSGCTFDFLFRDVELSFWVKKSDLATVTTNEVDAVVNGDSIRLAPGVVVEDDAVLLNNRSWFDKPRRIPAAVPKSDRGWKFVSAGLDFGAPYRKQQIKKAKAGFSFGGQTLTARHFTVSATKASQGTITATVETHCAVLSGRFDAFDPEPPKPAGGLGTIGGGLGGGLGGGKQRQTDLEPVAVKIGSTFYASDKRALGKTRTGFVFSIPKSTSSAFICNTFPLGLKDQSVELELCFKASTLYRRKRP